MNELSCWNLQHIKCPGEKALPQFPPILLRFVIVFELLTVLCALDDGFVIVTQTNCWYSNGYKLCSCCSRFVFILL